MFEGFELTTIDTGEARIRVRHGGSGPPLLLLHGNPQTHVMWHKIAPRLAQDFTVVAADLRGYGDSSKPPYTDDHAPYSKRAMARDQVEVMRQLGFERFFAGRTRPRRALRLPPGARPPRARPQAGRARHHSDRRVVSARRHAVWTADLALVLPGPAGGLPRAGDQPRRPTCTSSAGRRHSSRPRRGRTTGGATRIRTRSARSARTIGPAATIDYAHDEADRGKRTIKCPVLVLWGTRVGAA